MKNVLDATLTAIIVAIAAAVVYCAFTLVPTAAPPAVAVPELAPDEIHLGPVRGRATKFVVDELRVGGNLVPPSARGGPVDVSRGEAIVATGWALDDATNRAASRVVARVDSDLTIATVALPRPDVVAKFNLTPGSNSGFAIDVPTSDLDPGKHVLHFLVVGSDGATLLDTGTSIALVESASRAPLHPLVTLDALNDHAIDTKAPSTNVGTRAWTLSGWAVGDAATAVPFASLRFFVDGKPALTVARADPRPDAAAFLKTPALANAGFTARFPPLSAAGEHLVTLVLVAPDGRSARTRVSLSISR